MDSNVPGLQQEEKEEGAVVPSPLIALMAQLIADAASVATETNDPIHRRLLCVESLLRIEQFPVRTCMRIDELVEDYTTQVKEDVHEMMTDQRIGAQYEGLDSDRDTIEEVTAILRLVPEVLQRRKETKWVRFEDFEDEEVDDDEDEDRVRGEWVDVENENEGEYPIHCLVSVRDDVGHALVNLKAVPFIHLFAQLALEYNSFDDEERGGLLIHDEAGDNILDNLVFRAYKYKSNLSEGDCHRIDRVFTNEMIRLRETNLLTVDDIREFDLLLKLCTHRPPRYFPHHGSRFLIEWCPNLLVRPAYTGFIPLYYAAIHSILDFRFMFEYMIRYFPYRKGISYLFRTEGIIVTTTPFELACRKFERKQVIDVIEDVLAEYSGTTPINIVEALVSAVNDPCIHLDCFYFLIRRQPALLSSSSSSSSSKIMVPSSISKVESSAVRDDNNDDTIDDNGSDHGEKYTNNRTNRRDDNDDFANDKIPSPAPGSLKRKRSKYYRSK